MANESAMDAARRRAGLRPLVEIQQEEEAKRKADFRAKYGRVPRGAWRDRQEQAARTFPGRLQGPPHTARDVTGWVYIAGAYDRDKLVFVKIGYTSAKNPNTRVRAIAQGVPHRVELLAAIAGSPALELSYHREFYKAAVRGEWFEPSPDLMIRVETINSRGDCWKLHWGKKRKPR